MGLQFHSRILDVDNIDVSVFLYFTLGMNQKLTISGVFFFALFCFMLVYLPCLIREEPIIVAGRETWDRFGEGIFYCVIKPKLQHRGLPLCQGILVWTTCKNWGAVYEGLCWWFFGITICGAFVTPGCAVQEQISETWVLLCVVVWEVMALLPQEPCWQLSTLAKQSSCIITDCLHSGCALCSPLYSGVWSVTVVLSSQSAVTALV